MKNVEKIYLNLDTSALFLSYICLECAIDTHKKEKFLIKDIKKNCYKYLDTILNMIRNTSLSLSSRARMEFLLSLFPDRTAFIKSDIAKKLFLDIPTMVSKDDYSKYTKHVQPDNNVLKDIGKIFDSRFIYSTSQLLCDGNKDIKPRIITKEIIIIYLDNKQFLKYTCNKGKGEFSFIDNKMRNVLSAKQLSSKLKNEKDIKKIIALHMARTIKDIGIAVTSKIYDLTFLTYDNFAALISYKIFKVNTMLSHKNFKKILYYRVFSA